MSTDCLFCKIIAGDIPSEIVARTERVVAFNDVSPVAPTHVLVVPVEHLQDVGAVAAFGEGLLEEMGKVAAEVGMNADPDGWRWVFNTGRRSGQAVFHAHGHVLAGRDLGWPPG